MLVVFGPFKASTIAWLELVLVGIPDRWSIISVKLSLSFRSMPVGLLYLYFALMVSPVLSLLFSPAN